MSPYGKNTATTGKDASARSCSLERRGYPCVLCEAGRRARHLDRCTREQCATCDLIEGSAEDTYVAACVLERAA